MVDVVPQTMRVWTCRTYGGPETLALETLPVPQLAPDAVLIRVLATTVSSGDARVRACRFPTGMRTLGRLALGWNGPRRPILGTEAAGEVIAAASAVTRFRPGDRVIAWPDVRMGAHAEFLAMPANGKIVAWPDGLPLEQAASMCFGALTARHFLTKAALAAGERLLVIGASGAVGSAMVQLGRVQGAHVTAVCSAANGALVQSLGADAVIAYETSDFQRVGEHWDVIADCVAASDFASAALVLRSGGRYCAVAGGLREMLARGGDGRRIIAGPAASSLGDLTAIAQLAAQRAFVPLVDSVYEFGAMPEAHRRVDSGRKRGSMVVTVALDSSIAAAA